MNPTALLQGISLLVFLQWISTAIINFLGIPFPPALLGMLLLLLLLCTGIIKEESIKDICDILISKMGMLFLPAGVSVLLYFDVIAQEFTAIIAANIICSLAVLLVTAFLLQTLLPKDAAAKK